MPEFPFDLPWIRAFIGIIFGLVFGSFITMLGYRLPRKLDIVLPRSHCAACKHTLGIRDLFPVFSWLAHGGRCGYCKTPVHWRYPLVESLAAALFGISFGILGFGYAMISTCLVGSVILTLIAIRLSR